MIVDSVKMKLTEDFIRVAEKLFRNLHYAVIKGYDSNGESTKYLKYISFKKYDPNKDEDSYYDNTKCVAIQKDNKIIFFIKVLGRDCFESKIAKLHEVEFVDKNGDVMCSMGFTNISLGFGDELCFKYDINFDFIKNLEWSR